MAHLNQIETFMGLDDFGLSILAGTESDPMTNGGGSQLGQQLMDCSGGSCHLDEQQYEGLGALGGSGVNKVMGGQYGGLREGYRSDYGILNNIHQDNPHFGTSGAMGFGAGGIGGIRQDIGHSIRPGFGRNVGNFYDRPTRRRFNRHFQRGGYTMNQGKQPVPPGSTGYCYEQGMPDSYYPNRHSHWNPYSYNYDPYPHQEQQQPSQPPATPEVPIETELAAIAPEQIPGMPWVPAILGVLFVVILYNCDDFSKFFRV